MLFSNFVYINFAKKAKCDHILKCPSRRIRPSQSVLKFLTRLGKMAISWIKPLLRKNDDKIFECLIRRFLFSHPVLRFCGIVWTVKKDMKTLIWMEIFLCVFDWMKRIEVFENALVWKRSYFIVEYNQKNRFRIRSFFSIVVSTKPQLSQKASGFVTNKNVQ